MEKSKEERSKDRKINEELPRGRERLLFFSSLFSLSLIALRENPPGHPPAAPKARHREYPQVIFVLFIRRTRYPLQRVCSKAFFKLKSRESKPKAIDGFLRVRINLRNTTVHPYLLLNLLIPLDGQFLLQSELQKGGVPAAPSGTATLLRLSPSHRYYPSAPLAVTPFRYPRLPWLDGRCVQGPGTYSPRHG